LNHETPRNTGHHLHFKKRLKQASQLILKQSLQNKLALGTFCKEAAQRIK